MRGISLSRTRQGCGHDTRLRREASVRGGIACVRALEGATFRLRQCQTGAVDSSDSGLPLPDLRDRLEFAIRAEDYKAAANLRDELQRRQMDARVAVEEANRKFYAAFEAGDFKAMDRVWGQGNHIQVLHPGTQCIAGREGVMESWRLILKNFHNMSIRFSLEDVRIYAGDSDAFVTCVEVIDASDDRGRTAATNIFEKQGGQWVIVHHQGGPIPPPIKVSRLRSG